VAGRCANSPGLSSSNAVWKSRREKFVFDTAAPMGTQLPSRVDRNQANSLAAEGTPQVWPDDDPSSRGRSSSMKVSGPRWRSRS